MRDRVELEIRNNIAVVTLNRPDKHNALDRQAFEEIIRVGEDLAGDTSVRSVVLSGSGPSFCAGIDQALFKGNGKEGNSKEGNSDAFAGDLMQPRGNTAANFYQSAAMVWRALPVPVIAALHGVAYGAGLQIALGADMRIAAPECRLSIMEIRWGLIPDMGITATLRHVMPADRVRMLAYTGKVIDGAEALKLGMVTAVSEQPLDAAHRLAEEIAGRSPEAVRAMKQLFNNALAEPVDLALRREAALQLSLAGSANQREAVMANLQKRNPQFTDPE